MTKIQAGQKFLSQEGTIEVIDQATDITVNGKGTIVESDGYTYQVVEWKNKKYPDVPYVEKSN